MATNGIDAALELTTTTVALITTRGRAGPNVMAAEWTMMASYRPPMVMVVIKPLHATYRVVEESGEFGSIGAVRSSWPCRTSPAASASGKWTSSAARASRSTPPGA